MNKYNIKMKFSAFLTINLFQKGLGKFPVNFANGYSFAMLAIKMFYQKDTKKRHRKPMSFQRKQYYCFIKNGLNESFFTNVEIRM